MGAQTLLIEALDSRRAHYLKQLKACRRKFSVEAVHGLRVSVRRLLALARLIHTVTPTPRLQKIRSALKKQLDGFDDLRDNQVMQIGISEKREALPELERFRHGLEKRGRRLLRDAKGLIGNLKLGGLDRHLEKVSAKLVGCDVSAGLSARLLQATDDTYRAALRRYRRIDPALPDTIHRTRVAFRQFRYTLEVITPLLDVYPETNLIKMHDYQTTLGGIQDAEILLRTLTDFAAREDTHIPESVRRHYEQRYTESIAAFMKNKGDLFTFWRPRPERPFPWEVQHEPIHHPARQRRRTRNPA